ERRDARGHLPTAVGARTELVIKACPTQTAVLVLVSHHPLPTAVPARRQLLVGTVVTETLRVRAPDQFPLATAAPARAKLTPVHLRLTASANSVVQERYVSEHTNASADQAG